MLLANAVVTVASVLNVGAGYEPQPMFDRRSVPVYAMIALQGIAALALVAMTGVHFEDPSMLVPPLWAVLFVAGAFLLRRVGHPKVGGACETLALIYCQGLSAVPVIICLAHISLPFADAGLSRADAALGFDWMALAAYFRDKPALLDALVFAYRSFLWLPVLVVPALWAMGEGDRAWRLVLSAAVGVAMCGIVFPLVPAVGAFMFHGITPNDYPNLKYQTAWEFGPMITRIKGSTSIAPNMLSGFVSFPSYHAAAAVMYGWAMWPVRVRWPFAVFSASIAFSALIVGAHYLVDILAGLIVGWLSISLTGRVQNSDIRRALESGCHQIAAGVA